MEQDLEYRRQLVRNIKPEVEPLFRYMNWLEQKCGTSVSDTYRGEDIMANSISFPVYDGTLLSFIKEVQRTSLLDRNYVYTYVRYKMDNPSMERTTIEQVTIKNMEVLSGILSKYVYGGMIKGYLWSEAVKEGIFLEILKRYQELLTKWDQEE